jgi:hypothetical protein
LWCFGYSAGILGLPGFEGLVVVFFGLRLGFWEGFARSGFLSAKALAENHT